MYINSHKYIKILYRVNIVVFLSNRFLSCYGKPYHITHYSSLYVDLSSLDEQNKQKQIKKMLIYN